MCLLSWWHQLIQIRYLYWCFPICLRTCVLLYRHVYTPWLKPTQSVWWQSGATACIYNARPSQAAATCNLASPLHHKSVALADSCGPTLQRSWSSPTALASLQGVPMCINPQQHTQDTAACNEVASAQQAHLVCVC